MLSRELAISPGDAGALMSAYAVAGLVVSMPTAWLLRRLGPKHTLAAGALLTTLGSALGAVSGGFWELLLSRFLEGAGLGVVVVVAVVAVAAWFPPAQRGLPIGIFSTWLPLGSVGALYGAPALYAQAGWRAAWWLGSGLALASLLVAEALVSQRASGESGSPPVSTARPPGRWAQARLALRSPALPLASAFGLFQVSRSAFLTWAPSYLVMRGLSLGDAAALVGLSAVLTIPVCVVAGGLIRFLGPPHRVYSAGLLLSAPLLAAAFVVPPPWAAPVLLAVGALAAVIPTAVNLVAPEARPRGGSAGLAVATVAFGRNAGLLVGPLLAGAALQVTAFNWAVVAWGLAATSLAGGALGLLNAPGPPVRPVDRRRAGPGAGTAHLLRPPERNVRRA